MTLFLVCITVIISILAFQNHELKWRMLFYPELAAHGQWYRFLSCGFIHADFIHLGVNMYVLYTFGQHVEEYFGLALPFGRWQFLFMYLLTIVMANVRTFFKERNNPLYSSLGASGGVSGVVFSYIALFPTSKLGLLVLPIPIPAYIMGVLYLVYSHYMSRRSSDNINHDAHLWGAVTGAVYTWIQMPDLLLSYFQ